jgi:hypothetical protein
VARFDGVHAISGHDTARRGAHPHRGVEADSARTKREKKGGGDGLAAQARSSLELWPGRGRRRRPRWPLPGSTA